MWNKIFRNKSNKIKSGDCANGSASANHVASPNKSKLSKVVNSFSLKRTAKDGSARNVDKCDISFSDLTICRFLLEQDHSSEFAAPAEPVEVSIALEPCPICTRTFAPKTLAKHIVICEKAAMKKRKKFDSSKQRREGTDLADFLPKNFGLPPSKQEPKTPPKAAQQASTPILPKKQPEPVKATYLQQKKPATQAGPSIAVLKEKPKAVISRLLPPSEQCPYCERCFGIKAYDRHVEWCKEKTRIANPQQKSSVSVAKERLQARTKYRAPCLKYASTKRGANREKYSGLSCGDSTNSLSDGGSVGSGWKTKASSEEQKVNMSTSLCSSIMSDGIKVSTSESNFVVNNAFSNEPEESPFKIYGTKPEENMTLSNETSTKQTENNVEIEIKSSKVTKSSKIRKTPVLEAKLTQPSDVLAESLNFQCKVSRIPTKSVDQSGLLNSTEVNEENEELCVTPCTLDSELNLKPITTRLTLEQCRTSRVFLTDDEQESSSDKSRTGTMTTKSFAADLRNVDEQNVMQELKIEETKYTSFDDVPVGPTKPMPSPKQDVFESPMKAFIRQRKLALKSKEKSLSEDTVTIMCSKSPKSKQVFESNSEETPDIILDPKEKPTSLSDTISNHNLTFSLEEDEDSENGEGDDDVVSSTDDFKYSPSKSFTLRGMFDKYDPFLSAKRQLEELSSSTSINTPSSTSPHTPNTKTRLTSSISSSYTANPRSTPSNVKSNFHRTLSLRVPRKTTPSRSLFTPTPKPKPTIQRGISDEGPISSKFLKPEEYDEMPVKSVCVNDFAVNRHPDTHSTPKVIKRDSTTNRNRRILKLNLRNTDDRGISNPLSKTDSLAVFLQYENATRVTDVPIKLTEKDLKDKSNTLSKQTSLKSSATDLDCILSDKDKLSSLKNSLTNLLDCHNALADSPKVVDTYSFSSINKIHPIKLEPLPKMQSTKPHSSQGPSFPLSHSLKENDFIDPKLINVCDNLSMSVTKLSDSDLTSSSTDSMERTKLQLESQDHGLGIPKLSPLQQPISNRNSTEKRNLLKRQLRLGKNQFLYDMSPENDPFGIDCENSALIDIDSNKLQSSTSTIEPVLDEFDIEEFLSSFDDAEEYPLFKDYKEFLSNRSLNKLSNNSQNSIRSPTLESPILNDEGDNEEKNEIFSSNESFLKHESESVPYVASERSNTEFRSPVMDTNDNVIRSPVQYQTSCRSADDEDELPASDINQNNVRNSSERELKRVSSTNFEPSCDSATMMYPDDLDKLSSVESLTIRKCTSSKQSGDSAYGSLSRHSPVDRGTRRTTSTTSRHLSSAPSDYLYPTKTKILHKLDHKRRSRDLSVSSSSSEASLPNLHYPPEQLDKSHRDGDIQSKKDSRMSKFCHECGSKFLVTQAKFCMECGVKRIALD